MKNFYLIISIFFCSSYLFSQMPAPPTLYPGERWTELWSVSYDYQGNGSVRYAAQDPSNSYNWCAVWMAQQDSNTAAGIQRYIYYSYSGENGLLWTSNVLDVSSVFGFPDISTSNGIPVIACLKGNSSLSSVVYKDLLFGGYGFEQINGIPSNPLCSFPKIAGTTNGNIVTTATSVLRQSYRTTYIGAWSPWQQLSSADNSPGSYTVASGSSGRVSIFTMDFNLNNSIKLYRSTDNGTTFDNGTVIYFYFIDGNDTLYASPVGGFQAVYSTADPHLIFSVYKMVKMYNKPHGAVFTKPKILHWSQTTGVTQIAGKYNIPNLDDTLVTSSMASLCQPSVTISPSGRLTCSFTTFLNGNVQAVRDGSIVNAGEIYLSYSDNSGTTWSTPINITNTPGIEEKYSSFAANTNTDSFRVFYERDMIAGNWVQVPEWGKAPVYYIFKRFTTISDNEVKSAPGRLIQNFPNPFNPNTIINYELGITNYVTLKIYNSIGMEVTALVNQKQNAGSYEVEFDGSNLPSGVYFYTLRAGEFTQTKSMLLIK